MHLVFWYAALIKKKVKQVSSFLTFLVKYFLHISRMFQIFCDHIVCNVSIPNCFNLGSYNKSNSKNPNQTAYGTRLTSPNLFKQQITSSTSFVRSSCEIQNI